jgi:hypothetical protein
MIFMLTLLILLFSPGLSSAQSGLALDSGEMAFYNFGNVSGSSIEMGNMEFYNFSNGQSMTRQSLGDMDFYSSTSRSLGGSVLNFGTMGFGTWNDGTTSNHMNLGGLQFDTYQRGGRTTTCTSQRFQIRPSLTANNPAGDQ